MNVRFQCEMPSDVRCKGCGWQMPKVDVTLSDAHKGQKLTLTFFCPVCLTSLVEADFRVPAPGPYPDVTG